MASTTMDTARSYTIAAAASRMVWLAELDATCDVLLGAQSPASMELAAELRAAAADRVRFASHKPPTAFRFYPSTDAVAVLLTGALEQARRQLWYAA